MLGKLLKHEFKQNSYVLFLMIIAVIVITSLAFIFGVLPTSYILSSYNGVSFVASVSASLSAIGYIIAMTAVAVGINIYIGLRYYNTMYSNTGYMTNTLPLKINELLLGKIISGTVILFIIRLAVALSGLALLSSVNYITGENADFIFGPISKFSSETYILLNLSFSETVILAAVNLVTNTILTTMILFLSATLGQLFNTHRVLMSVVSFVVISIFTSMLDVFLGFAFDYLPVFLRYINHYNIILSLISVIFQSVVLMTGFYALSYYIVKYRLNLE